MQTHTPDIRISDEGSIVRFWPVTPAGKEALGDVDAESWQWFGRSLCVDHRMAGGLIDHLVDNGLSVEV